MKDYDIFSEDGRYLRSVTCSDITQQIGDNEQWAAQDGHPSHCKVLVAGAVVNLPPQPSFSHRACPLSKSWVLDSPAVDYWPEIRMQRGARLSATDWTQLSDVPEAIRQRYVEYRQALRDVTKQPDPLNIVWPTPPN